MPTSRFLHDVRVFDENGTHVIGHVMSVDDQGLLMLSDIAVEAEKDRLIEMERMKLEEKESEERISRAKFWDKVQANILYFLSFAFVIYIFILIKHFAFYIL